MYAVISAHDHHLHQPSQTYPRSSPLLHPSLLTRTSLGTSTPATSDAPSDDSASTPASSTDKTPPASASKPVCTSSEPAHLSPCHPPLASPSGLTTITLLHLPNPYLHRNSSAPKAQPSPATPQIPTPHSPPSHRPQHSPSPAPPITESFRPLIRPPRSDPALSLTSTLPHRTIIPSSPHPHHLSASSRLNISTPPSHSHPSTRHLATPQTSLAFYTQLTNHRRTLHNSDAR